MFYFLIKFKLYLTKFEKENLSNFIFFKFENLLCSYFAIIILIIDQFVLNGNTKFFSLSPDYCFNVKGCEKIKIVLSFSLKKF